jgi:O-antigen/teichoic acid export membrane protein
MSGVAFMFSGPLSLRKNASFMLIGNLIYSLSQWGLIMILAKLGSPSLVGEFTLALAVTAPIILIFDFQLRSVLATDTAGEFPFSHYLALKAFSSLAALLVLGLVLFISGYQGQVALVILIVGLTKLVESVIELYYGLYQKNERMDMIAKSLALRGILSLAVVSILMYVTTNLVISLVGFFLTWLFLFMLELSRAKQWVIMTIINIPITSVKRLFLKSLPLGVVMMMISLYTNIPRYMIENKLGTEAVGYFSALFYIVTAGNIVINAIGQSISPRLAHYYNQGENKRFTKLLIQCILLGLLYGITGTVLAILLGKQVLGIFYTDDYVKYHQLLILLMVAGTLMYTGSFLGVALTAMRKFKIQPLLSVIWVLSTFVLCIVIIPSFGLTGAAYVSISTTGIQLLTLAATVLWYLAKAGRISKTETVTSI